MNRKRLVEHSSKGPGDLAEMRADRMHESGAEDDAMKRCFTDTSGKLYMSSQ